MTRIIQLTIDSPWPSRSGGDIRNAFVAKSASAVGSLHIVSFGAAASSSQSEFDITTTHIPSFEGTIPWHRHDPRLRTLIQLTADDLQFLEKEIQRHSPDIAICEGVGVCAAVPLLRRLGVPHIVDMHNIESVLYRSIRRKSSSTKFLKDILFGKRQWRGAANFDRDMSLQAEETWVTSKSDRSQLLKMGGAESFVVPNPIPDESYARLPINSDRYASKRGLFVGHLSYPPNITAARELATKIWPLVRESDADASLLICGRTPTSSLLRLGERAGLTIQADPKCLYRIYGEHGYSLMAIRQGGGTRIKVLEAMVAGTVVIATEKAVEGLELTEGKHYLRAERPIEFQRHIERACANPQATAALAQEARDFVLGKYGLSRLSDLIQTRIEGVAARGLTHPHDARISTVL